MPALLISLGTSPAIVPEAFLFPGAAFTAVHVLTTDSTDVLFVQEWFGAHAPHVELTITRVDGFRDFTSEEDHFRFEEVLYRWWLEKVGASLRLDSAVEAGFQRAGQATEAAAEHQHAGSPLGQVRHPGRLLPPFSHAGSMLPHVCLSGGFKTMSAAVQKAAAVLGAAEVFHVLCDLPQTQQPKTAEEIEAACKGNHLHWIKLGSESGWPQLSAEKKEDYSLTTKQTEGCVSWVTAPDHSFRSRLREIVERSHNVAGAWDQIGSLPFATLATWSAADLAWLHDPVDPEADRAWIQGLPKVELHCHLGGFATHGEKLQQVRDAAEHPDALPVLIHYDEPVGWPFPSSPVPLKSYMQLGDATGSALLIDRGCLRRQCELLYQDLLDQNVVYAEIRCSPANYAKGGRSPWDVLSDIKETFDRCMVEASVAASVPLAGGVSSPVPGGVRGYQPGSLLSQDDETLRQFHSFDKESEYGQTWRDLPHRHQAGTTAFLSFRLADSLPQARLEEWSRERKKFLLRHPKPWSEEIWKEYQRSFPERLETWLDEAQGACWLRDPEIAAVVAEALSHFDGDRYILDRYVIMPNHVHVLVKPIHGYRLDQIVHSWKSFSAKEINKRLLRKGQVWEHESFDHLLRSAKQLAKVRKYIEENPEKAGLREGYLVGTGMGVVVGGGASSGMLEGTDTAPRRPAVTHVNLIIIATRKENGDYRAAISRHLALAVSAAEHWNEEGKCRVVGVDLAGFEDKETRAHYFREEFTGIHRCGLALTVHAGENDDAEGIWRAVFDLNARRLGHALHLIDSPELMRSVADRGIGVEMCPYANLQIKGFPVAKTLQGDRPVESGFQRVPSGNPASLKLAGTAQPPPRAAATYPLKRYLDAGVRVTVNTDNIGISAASLTDNFLLAARMCPGLTRLDVLRLISNAVEASFLSSSARRALRNRLETHLGNPSTS